MSGSISRKKKFCLQQKKEPLQMTSKSDIFEYLNY